ncbi:MAG: sensor histidine kinase [Paenibacillaceae bacterium]|nr:sensor histidine kinase [Paenibacillaceae bacterium]
MTLYQKIVLPLVCIVVIPTVLLGLLAFQRSSEQIEAMTRTLLLDNLQHNIKRLNERLTAIEAQSENVIASEKLRFLLGTGPPAALVDELEFIRQIYALIGELKGDYELTLYPKQLDKYPNYNSSSVTPDTPWFRQAIDMGGRPFWRVESPSGGPVPQVLHYVRSVRSIPLLETLAVMDIRIPAFVLTNDITAPEHLRHVRFTVIDGQGGLIMADKGEMDGLLAALLGTPAPEPGSDRIRTIVLDGKPHYEASLPVGKNDWRLVATIPVADLMGPVDNIKTFMWWLVAAGIALMVVFAMLLVKLFTTPIKSLVHHMRRIHRGELAYYPHYAKRGDEIGQLMHGYNSMVSGMLRLIDNTKEIEEEKRRLEMRTLIHQINPHFLYNTMDAIRWRAERAGESTIAEMVASLVNLLRFSINNGEELTTVEREIEHVRSYLHIETKRAGETFQALFHIQPHVMQAPFMKLTIQPLVENAVKHAIKKNGRDGGGGKIMISLLREDDCLVCRVEDNGPGNTIDLEEHFRALDRQHGNADSGVGLYNTNRRLQLRFGEAYGIRLDNREGGGCTATLVHPLLEPESANGAREKDK